MISIILNGKTLICEKNLKVFEVCKLAGITIPRFCYNESISDVGSCRTCIVEIENIEKPVASCITIIENGMRIWTDTAFVRHAQEIAIENHLLNHPLDCPICDQAGECDLQDQAKIFGNDFSKYYSYKKVVEDKNCGPIIKTIMTRCITCTRCVRFSTEIAGNNYFGTLNRGRNTEIGGYVEGNFDSELSGNIVDLCPVGALTAHAYAFKGRPWELELSESVDTTDGLGSNIYINSKDLEIARVLPKSNYAINKNLISDKTRFSYDAFNYNRITNVFCYNLDKRIYDKIDWNLFLNRVDNIIKSTKKIEIIINKEVDIINLHFLNILKNSYPNFLSIKIISSKNDYSNFYIQGLSSNLLSLDSTIKNCILLSCNPKIESSVLNTKLKLQFNENYFSIISLGQTFLYNIPIFFFNLNVNKTFSLFRGKKKKLSETFISSYNSIVFFNENLGSQLTNIEHFTLFLKKKYTSLRVFKITNYSNSEGIKTFNFKSLSTKQLVNTNSRQLFGINLDENIITKKIFYSLYKNLFWFNSHGSKIAGKSQFIIPTVTSFESEYILFNLEQRPQKTNKIFNFFFDAKPIYQILLAIFNFSKKKYLLTKPFSYIFELLNHYKFNKLTKILTNNIIKNNNINKYNVNKIFIINSIYKSNTSNFYLSNTFTKNSKLMQQYSQYDITNKRNFFF